MQKRVEICPCQVVALQSALQLGSGGVFKRRFMIRDSINFLKFHEQKKCQGIVLGHLFQIE